MKYTLLILTFFALGLTVQAQNIPIDFESTDINYVWTDFEGGVVTIIDNPDPSGLNTSAKVGRMVKFAGEDFAGSLLTLDGALDFGDNTSIAMKVWANRVDAPVLLKLEGPVPVEVSVSTTVASEWEEMTFDFTGLDGGTYTGITIIYDLGAVGDGSADFTFYFDDLLYSEGDGIVRPTLPIDFESTEIPYAWGNFAGGVTTVISNPDPAGINTSATVCQMVKFEDTDFGGSVLPLGRSLDFGDNTSISMKVWSNRVGAPVLFKLEGPIPVQVNVPTTVANEWEELIFNFTGLTGGTYSGITIIYDLGVIGNGSADFTLYFDDITYSEGDGISRPVLPISFESTDVEYQWGDFAGGAATVINNPDPSGINTSATIGQMIKFQDTDFGGSTLTLGGAVDFGDNTTISMKVWANRVGAPVLLKLEGPIPTQVEASTTVANEWEELTFDFTGMTTGPYNRITIIYDLGVIGNGSADFTLFFDDIEFFDPNNVRNFADLGINMYPNPVADFLNIQAETMIDMISVYNLLGQQVLEVRPEQTMSTLDLSSLAPGTYAVRLLTAGGDEAVAKFVKQ